MEYLNWIAEHWVISLVALYVLLMGLTDIARALRGKS